MRFTCTFTGVDHTVDLNDLYHLSAKFPFIEWGLLFSKKRAGNELKYPVFEAIEEFIKWKPDHVKASLHLCGGLATTTFLLTPNHPFGAKISKLVNKFNRIQLNITGIKNDYVAGIFKQVKIFENPFIIQYNENNTKLINTLLSDNQYNKFIHVLKDASGGNGIVSEDFSIPESCSNTSIGFAGGLGPDNIERLFPKIYNSVISENVEGKNNNPMFWIDMESKIRNENNEFDLKKVEYVAAYIDNFLKTNINTFSF